MLKEPMMKRKTVLLLFCTLCILLVLSVLATGWIKERIKNARIIKEAIANPKNITAGRLLNGIDSSFSGLGEEEKKAILENPEMMDARVAEATYKELKKSFDVMFQLPEPLRRHIIRESADNLSRILKKDPNGVDDFFDSPGADGVMKGVGKLFFLELSGKEKAELAPLIKAFNEIAKAQAKRRKTK